MSNSVKKKWSTKKKVLVISLSIVSFLLVAIICTGIGVLRSYCKVEDYNIVSAQSVISENVNIIAHRGFRAMAPENTAPAYDEAGKAGYWGSECDIHRTSDGVWVLQHDVNTYRMMDKTKSIEKSTIEELKNMTTDNGCNIENYPNLSITTLDEYMKICEQYNMVAVIELKGANNTEHYDEIITTINKYDVQVQFISFKFKNLEVLSQLSDAPMFYLTQVIDDEVIETAKSIKNCGIGFNGNKEENFENDIISKCQSEGLELSSWTINSLEIMEKLVSKGVKYITTDCITY